MTLPAGKDLEEYLFTAGKDIAQEAIDLILARCANHSQLPEILRSTVARVAARTVHMVMIASLDVTRDVAWWDKYGQEYLAEQEAGKK